MPNGELLVALRWAGVLPAEIQHKKRALIRAAHRLSFRWEVLAVKPGKTFCPGKHTLNVCKL